MIHTYYQHKIEQVLAERSLRLAALRTPEQARRYVAEARRKVTSCFGPFPERTPLNARVTGTLALPGIQVEKVVFESRPHFPVTGLLYLPQDLSEPAPAVLGLCGHSPSGKAAPNYQIFCQALALKGFVVFMIDPIGQGERVQYLEAARGQGVDWCCEEHNMLGKQLRLCGDFFGDWRLWDAVRALDYLLGRPEVDPARVGVTGNSGGGTLSTYLNALDDRPTMAAISCFITSYQHNYDNELPADSEQIPPGILARRCDMADFIIARAPRPVLILGQQNDFFDPRGTRKAFEEVQRVYDLLGAGDRARLLIGPESHGYGVDNRQAMYGCFTEWAAVDVDGTEPAAVDPLSDDQLWCTEEGQVGRLPGTRRVYTFIQERAQALRTARGTASPAAFIPWLADRLAIPADRKVPYVRTPRRHVIERPDGLLNVSRFALRTEPHSEAMLLLIDPKPWYHLPP